MPSSFGTIFGLAFGIAIPIVSAHGFVSGIVAGGKWWAANDPSWYYQAQKPARAGWYALNQDTGYVGVSDYGSEDMTCHKSATPGNISIEVTAGETIDLEWTDWPESHHGPVITSLARCHPDCETAKPEQLRFFTVDAQGLIDGSSPPGTWASDQLIENNNTWSIRIPNNLSGNFVLRHEIIALHSAFDQNGEDGAQNYPNCINLKVLGRGQTHPCLEGADCRFGTELYGTDDPGVLLNIYYPALENYTIPGPTVWSGLVKGDTSGYIAQ